MNNFTRTIIFNKVIKQLQNIDDASIHKVMSNLHVKFNNLTDTYSFACPLQGKDYDVLDEVKDFRKNDLDDTFSAVTIKDKIMYFDVPRNKYVKNLLENNFFGVKPPILAESNKNIIVEFSSPNIAKPFHLGHMRSTILGNCISNISAFLQNRVTKINYLGDWGTQFGYIHLGLQQANVDNIKMQSEPMKTLYNAYVTANTLAEQNPEISEQAKEVFKQLELRDSVVLENWQTIKQFTVAELKKTYNRLGVEFDKYDWESMYTAKDISKITNSMNEMKLLMLDEKMRKVIAISNDKTVPIIKSDGTTLYMSRDIAAAIDRYEKHKFDAMYYVVDYGQSNHFSTLFEVLKKMQLPWADRLKHVKFGRVQGMSTRKGTAVFLEDILNEAQAIMKERQQSAKTTKVAQCELDQSSDILGISGVIIQDLKQSRTSNYKFTWKSMLDMQGDSGIKLQYTHCRLCSLEKLFSDLLSAQCDPDHLKEPEVDNLIALISQFDEVVIKSYNALEPCILTIYLFHLCKAINGAFHELRIKDVPSDIGSQRLLLFHVARITLAQGMKLLGLTPLERM